MTNAMTSTADRALTLLGQGIAPAQVAAALGVTESYISQLVSDEQFAARVAELRYESLQKHNARDNAYDAMEDKLLERMEDLLPLMHRPMEILKAIQVINAAKRRGQSAPENITNKQTVIPLILPVQIINSFKVNPQGQVVEVGKQPLLTIQSGNMDALLKEKRDENDSQQRAAIAP